LLFVSAPHFGHNAKRFSLNPYVDTTWHLSDAGKRFLARKTRLKHAFWDLYRLFDGSMGNSL
jgi:hypothetical protein